MKAVILAGGQGTRISEETHLRPKPMVEIGGKPILWHIMKIYEFYGINDFVICCGYKGKMIKEFFEDDKGKWNVECVDTGLNTMTGGRIKKIEKYVDDTFSLTYGDTLSNVNLDEIIKIHKQTNKIATVTACNPPEKYGVLKIENNNVISFSEKPLIKDIWINGGFFILEQSVFEYIKDEKTSWEEESMIELVKRKQLSAFKHTGFYQSMDTMKEKNILNKLWDAKKAEWKVW